MTADGSQCWKLVDLPLDFKNWPGILHPHFSHNGRQLVWAQRTASGSSVFGAWVIKLADFRFERTKPVLTNIKTLRPGQTGRSRTFYETHGFSPDGQSIIFSSLTAPGGSVWITDLVSHESETVHSLMLERYGEYLYSMGGADYRTKVFDYIDREDSPRPVTYQLDLLRKVGFRHTDLLHKKSCFAAFCAIKIV